MVLGLARPRTLSFIWCLALQGPEYYYSYDCSGSPSPSLTACPKPTRPVPVLDGSSHTEQVLRESGKPSLAPTLLTPVEAANIQQLSACHRDDEGETMPILLQRFSMKEAWHAWLQCQPKSSHQRRRWGDPASWVYWHIEYWESYVKQKEGQNYPQRWTGEEWARWKCDSLCRAQYTNLGDGMIRVSPAVVLFTQGCISRTFGGGRHSGMPVDDTIQHIQAEPNRASSIPEIHVFELDGRLYSVNNRRLYAFRVRYPRGDNGKSQITRLGTPEVRYPRG